MATIYLLFSSPFFVLSPCYFSFSLEKEMKGGPFFSTPCPWREMENHRKYFEIGPKADIKWYAQSMVMRSKKCLVVCGLRLPHSCLSFSFDNNPLMQGNATSFILLLVLSGSPTIDRAQ